MMPLTVVRFGSGFIVVHRGPTSLANVKINRPASAAVIGADVEKWVTVASVALGEKPQIVLAVAIDLGLHGDGKQLMLVGREMIGGGVYAAEEGLIFIGEREGVADFALDDIVGGHVI